MDQGKVIKQDEFSCQVQSILGPFLYSKGYCLDSIKVDKDGLNTTVVYVSGSRKLAVYRSIRDGEVNCLVGGSNASTENIGKPSWQYLTKLLLVAGVITREKLYAISTETPKDWNAQLKENTAMLISNFDTLVTTSG